MLCAPEVSPASPVPVPAGVVRFSTRRRLADVAVGAGGQHRALTDFRDRPVLALAAIARPQAFFAMLAAAGMTPRQCLALPDHADASTLRAALANWQGEVLCTEKDLVKLDRLPAGVHAWGVPLALDIEPAFFEALDAHLGSLRR
jgi:tetraacyldisaccharide 4'-kinase